MNNVNQVMENLAISCGIDKNSIHMNDRYLTWILDPSYETIALCSVLIVGIIAFSVTIIYNIFQVGITQKIQEYGKIKILGATRKQLRHLIFMEGVFLAILSIPMGVTVGFVISKISFSWLMKQGNLVTSGVQVSTPSLFSFSVILFSVIVSILAVLLALVKPMKLVLKNSPMESTRYLDYAQKHNGIRKGRKQVSVCSLAFADILGNKKRTFGTIVTMGLSCVLFITVSSYTGNIDIQYEARRSINYGQFELQLEYSLEDEAYQENNLNTILKNNPLNNELIEKLRCIEEVTDVKMREVAVMEINGKNHVVSIFNEDDFESHRWEGNVGNMDYEDAVKNGDIFYGWAMGLKESGYDLNMPISCIIDNGTASYHYSGRIAGAFAVTDTSFVIPKEVYQKLQPNGTSYGYVWVDCDQKDADIVEREIGTIIEGMHHLKLKTYHNELQTAKFSSQMMRMGCYLFLMILGLIGFMNLANTMIINITTKKQEYGILQAVGMTNKQLNQSLQIQGLIFTAGTVIVALMVGLPLGYFLFSYAKQKDIFGVNMYHVPMVSIVVMVLLVGGLQVILSYILSRNLKKETLVERIRYQG